MKATKSDWKVIKSKELHRNRFFTVEKDTIVLPNQKVKEFIFIDRPNAVMVAPIKGDNILLIEHYRHIPDKINLELPGGSVHLNEEPIVAAKRELLEETGYSANRLELINSFYTSNGTSTEKIYFYKAWDLDEYAQNLEDSEYGIKITPKKLKDCIDMVQSGEIDCMSTALCLMLLNKTK